MKSFTIRKYIKQQVRDQVCPRIKLDVPQADVQVWDQVRSQVIRQVFNQVTWQVRNLIKEQINEK